MNNLPDVLAFIMVPVAFLTILEREIERMIHFYQLQSLVLFFLTLFTAFSYKDSMRLFIIIFAVLIPGLLTFIVDPLLAQATARRTQEESWWNRLRHPFLSLVPFIWRNAVLKEREKARSNKRQARLIWQEHSLSRGRQLILLVVGLGLSATAFSVAPNLVGKDVASTRVFILAISMTLFMLGIVTMISRDDVISQVIGLLVLDHGLFLAVVRVTQYENLITYFIISLFIYILITLLILAILLPELHRESKTINVRDQSELRG